MAQSDAIMDYSNNGRYSTAAKAADVLAVWEANKGDAENYRSDHGWSGDPTAAASTPLSGWDEGTWKVLPSWKCPYDSSYQLPEWTAAHTMIRDIKRIFNLPNQGTDSNWMDSYTPFFRECENNGETTCFIYMSKNMASAPMLLSKPSMISESISGAESRARADSGLPPLADAPGADWPQTGPLLAESNIKCTLLIGLQGFDLDVGVGRGMSYTVRPDDNDVATYNNHYKALRDANTPAADYTDPPLSGTEHVVEGNILLINFENQFRVTTMNKDTDRILLSINWANHTYAQIKALMDAAIA